MIVASMCVGSTIRKAKHSARSGHLPMNRVRAPAPRQHSESLYCPGHRVAHSRPSPAWPYRPRRAFAISRIVSLEALMFGKLFASRSANALKLTFTLRSEEHTSELQSRRDLVC